MRSLILLLGALLAAPVFAAPSVKNVVVYYEPGRFGGWPANNGIWNWGDEILVGFSRAYFEQKADEHSVDKTKPSGLAFARSRDGGETWTIEDAPESLIKAQAPTPCPGGINFTHPDFAMRVRNEAFHISYDRGRTWQGPYAMPTFQFKEVSSRTDYLVQGPQDCLVFMSAKDSRVRAGGDGDGLKDRAFCARTRDGGKTFEFVGWMTEEVPTIRSVMPATVRAADGSLVTLLRRRFDLPTEFRNDVNFIDAYGSHDDGKSWKMLERIAYTDATFHNGNPPSLVKLPDGRLAAAWGSRTKPFGVRARVSEDHGKTWGPEMILRGDGRTWDIGYCRSVVRKDGKIVTVYYYATKDRFENHIEATIWTP